METTGIAFTFSGDSKVLVEHKNRIDQSNNKYYTEGAFMEKQKFDKLREPNVSGGCKLLYVNHCPKDDLVFIWDIMTVSGLPEGEPFSE